MSIFSKLFGGNRHSVQTIPAFNVEIQSTFSAFSVDAYNNPSFRAPAISRHVGKLRGRCEGDEGLERLLSVAPNGYMTAFDLLYKTATAYYTIQRGNGGGGSNSQITALYPLTPSSVEFARAQGAGPQDGARLCVKMTFADGRTAIFDYIDIVHLKRHYSLTLTITETGLEMSASLPETEQGRCTKR